MPTSKLIAGPDPNPVKPHVQLPVGACDAHCHVFGLGDVFSYHPNRSYTPPDAPKEKPKALRDHSGIDRAVIVHASCHGMYMEATLDAIASSRGKCRGASIVKSSMTMSFTAFMKAASEQSFSV